MEMSEQFVRTQMLLGKDALTALNNARVAVFGIGGVGGYVCEALVRSGVGAFDLIDNDRVSLSNLNRQIIATRKTIGRYKVDVMKERMLEINPQVDVRIYKSFFLPENADDFPFGEYNYIADAVDTVAAKLELIVRANRMNIPVISAMGAGNKLDAGRLRIADIYETTVCPLARIMRRELRMRGITQLKVVYSDEQPMKPVTHATDEDPADAEHKSTGRRDIPGSTAFVPAVAGMLMAGEIIRDLTKDALRSGAESFSDGI